MINEATRLRALAAGMDKQIDAKMNPGCANQNMTRKRIEQARSMRIDGARLQMVQTALRRLADAHESGEWAVLEGIYPAARGLNSKAAVERLMTEGRTYLGIDKDGRSRYTESVLEKLAGGKPEETVAAKIRRLEEGLVGVRMPGFFPTPRELADRVVSMAAIGPGQTVLEPSAGKGDLADRILAQAPYSTVATCELRSGLAAILTAKGYDPNVCDIMDLDGPELYDRVVMNPPFEDGQDVDHVRHCFEKLLKPGGRLVSIVSEAVFFRTDRKYADFREWMAPKLFNDPEQERGAFTGAAAFRQTGTATRVIVLDKEAAA